jgi:hypothetical protein
MPDCPCPHNTADFAAFGARKTDRGLFGKARDAC